MVQHQCADVTTSDHDRPKRTYFRPSSGPRDTRTGNIATRRGQSWKPAPEPGAQSKTPAWTSADQWIEALTLVLDTPDGEQIRRTVSIKTATLLDVAAVEACVADSRTGRDVATAHATVAKLVGCSVATVRRARKALELLEMAATVMQGRYLTTSERAEAHAHHGGRQRRIASLRALSIPQYVADIIRNEHLPRRGKQSVNHTFKKITEKPRTRLGKKSTTKKAGLSTQKLAAKLVVRLPQLGRHHIGRLCQALKRLGLDDEGWTATDIIDALTHKNRRQGLMSIPASRQRHPVRLFEHECRQAGLDKIAVPPKKRRGPSRLGPAPTLDQQRREDAASRARVAAWRADATAQAAHKRRLAALREKIHIATRRHKASSLLPSQSG